MACYKPLSAWRQPASAAGGKSTIVFGRDHKNNWDIAKSLDLPCGQCIGCRLERSRRWAVRIMHESQMHEKNSFLTLTYDDAHVPTNGSLVVDDFQKFMKRLRRGSATSLRFFHCGEYGEQKQRPHYHCCLFGEDFSSDRVFEKKTEAGHSLWTSPTLSEKWGLGHAWIGELTFESAAYVARYCLKKASFAGKANGLEARKNAYAHWLDGRAPEYVTMSRRPGIGSTWFERNRREVYPSDSVVLRGREMLPPPFYDKVLEKLDPKLFEEVKRERVIAQGDFYENPDNRSRRLIDRHRVKQQTVKHTLKRSL